MMSQKLLVARNLVRILPGEVPVTLVNDVSLEINAGEFVAITGPSGSGKSSLLYLLGLLDLPTKGSLLVEGQETTSLTEEQRAHLRLEKLGFVFQSHLLLPEFSALENVLLPMRRLGANSEVANLDRARALLAELGLEEHAHKLPRQLSGGQNQRVAIARALANTPKLLFADEPTGNLDSKSSAVVQEIFKRIARTTGSAVIAVTHDTGFAAITDLRFHIVDGKLSD